MVPALGSCFPCLAEAHNSSTATRFWLLTRRWKYPSAQERPLCSPTLSRFLQAQVWGPGFWRSGFVAGSDVHPEDSHLHSRVSRTRAEDGRASPAMALCPPAAHPSGTPLWLPGKASSTCSSDTFLPVSHYLTASLHIFPFFHLWLLICLFSPASFIFHPVFLLFSGCPLFCAITLVSQPGCCSSAPDTFHAQGKKYLKILIFSYFSWHKCINISFTWSS